MFATFKKNAVVMTAALLAYAGVFYLMHTAMGRGMTIAVVIPVVAAAWCFGLFWGAAAALLSVAANSALCAVFGIDWQEHVVVRGALIPGTASLVGIALLVGYMRALRARLQRTINELSNEVAERRGTEEQLRELMQFSDNVIESSLDSIVVGDARGTIRRVNRALLDMSGYSKEELIGQSPIVLSYIAPGDYCSSTGEAVSIDDAYMLKARAQHEKLFETGRILNWQYYIVRKDARLVPAEGSIVMLHDAAGETVGSLAIIRDISARRVIEQELERHRAHLHELVQAKTGQLLAREQELRESEERFRAVVQLANEAIVIIDAQGSIIFWNQGAEKIYGYSAVEILSQPVLVLVPESNRTLHTDMLAIMNARDDMPGNLRLEVIRLYRARHNGAQKSRSISGGIERPAARSPRIS